MPAPLPRGEVAARPTAATLAALRGELAAWLGARVSAAPSVLDLHGRDESSLPPASPDLVCLPTTTDEVAAVVIACARRCVPVIPWGAGTSLEGHALATRGGVAVDLSRMNRILAIRDDDLDASVEAGVTRKQLNAALADRGLMFTVDPGADATLGGMASTRASGTNTVRYGTMRDNVLALTVVLADGRVIRTAGRARKSSAGYDLTRLFIGAEGTLGIITELTVRLFGVPEAMVTARVSFPTLEAATQTVIRTVQLGIPVARLELLDPVMVDAVNRYARLDEPVAPTLLLELHGSPATVAEQAEEIAAVARELGGGDFRWASAPEDRESLWAARHHAFFAGLALRPGARAVTTDVCVPISRLAACIEATQADLAASGLVAPLVAHAGDGNFHLLILVDPNDADELARAGAVHRRLVERALAMDGTATGEHGIGLGKRDFLLAEHGPAVDVMRAVKQAVDPHGIMNPGKLLPDAS